jgi:flagellar basal body rod protein FlgF
MDNKRGNNMYRICFFLLVITVFNIYANDDLFNEYNILYNDLKNFDVYGYKSSWNSINNKGSDKINISQGVLWQTGSDTDYAILREGFFKIRLENGMIGYTRYGNFLMAFGDSESEFTLRTARYGYRLYDPIIISMHTVNLKLEGNILYTFLSDGTKVEAGQVNIYEINEEKLIRYKDSIFITSDNYDSQIINASRIITGFVEMSNVNILETLLRMHIILWELKNYGYNYDDKDQIIMMLINNIPILDELSWIRMKLYNKQPQFPQFMVTDFRGLNLLKDSINFIKID